MWVVSVCITSFKKFICGSSVVPPSLPVCQWDGDINMGGSVRLSCLVAEGIPTPEIRWDKLNPDEISLPINMESQLHTHTRGYVLNLKHPLS